MKETWHEIETPPEGITLAAALLRVPMTPDERRACDAARYSIDPQSVTCLPGMVVHAQGWVDPGQEITRIWHLLFIAAPELAPDETVQTSAPEVVR